MTMFTIVIKYIITTNNILIYYIGIETIIKLYNMNDLLSITISRIIININYINYQFNP